MVPAMEDSVWCQVSRVADIKARGCAANLRVRNQTNRSSVCRPSPKRKSYLVGTYSKLEAQISLHGASVGAMGVIIFLGGRRATKNENMGFDRT